MADLSYFSPKIKKLGLLCQFPFKKKLIIKKNNQEHQMCLENFILKKEFFF